MPKLFMVLAGASPQDRNIEQHDVYFGVGETLIDIIPGLKQFWPVHKLHIDAWREVTAVNGCSVTVLPADRQIPESNLRLFFINLGGYKPEEFEEFHYKMIIAAKDKTEAINTSKNTAFFRHTGMKGAHAHIDDKYGIDVDDIFEIKDILDNELKSRYRIVVNAAAEYVKDDDIQLGYLKLSSFT